MANLSAVKQCRPAGCGKHLPVFMFNNSSNSKDGLHSYCQPCAKRRSRDYSRKQQALGSRRWQKIKYEFGVTKEQYEAKWKEQGECCAICKTTEAGGRGAFHVDHNHETDEFRGILCNRCNVGIGYLGDSPDRLKSALTYLEENGHYG